MARGCRCPPHAAAAAGLLLLVTAVGTSAQAPDRDEKPEYISLPLDGLLRTERSSLGLVPFPRVGKRAGSMGLVPFPRVGRARSMGLVPFPRVGRARSMGLVPFPRVGRRDTAMDKRQSLIPYPRIGKKSLMLEELADKRPWSDEVPLQAASLQLADMNEPTKRNWDAPRLGGYKRSGCRAVRGRLRLSPGRAPSAQPGRRSRRGSVTSERPHPPSCAQSCRAQHEPSPARAELSHAVSQARAQLSPAQPGRAGPSRAEPGRARARARPVTSPRWW
ncbi:uncharacterized protein LOC119108528 [Pollicipes pollicipes]|uniref:uncharacterized protein LOC119108528 n=1 Tax=Pollicipes pollicipes TaxID=41117 RepID=UPI001884C805|nr:uncharacterized protein LOC119108528 [Pollicipes pollicipes]